MPPRFEPGPEFAAAGTPVVSLPPNLWEEFVEQLDPRTACELLGIEHFPHYLASAANLLILAEHLAAKYGTSMTVRQALVAELKAGPHPPSGSENTQWWKLIEPHVKEWEAQVMAFMKSRGALAEDGHDDDD